MKKIKGNGYELSWEEGRVKLLLTIPLTCSEYNPARGMEKIEVLPIGEYIFTKKEGMRHPELPGHIVEMEVLGRVKIDGHEVFGINFLYDALHKYIEGYRPSRAFQEYDSK